MIKFIKVGQINKSELTEISNFYLKQLPRKHLTITVKDESDISKRYLEGNNILKHIKSDDYVITLEILGKQMTSEKFAKKINEIEVTGKNIVFIIGGSYGLDEKVIERSNLSLSFSKFTFPHQLMYLILVEQVYRAYSILNNKPYHK